MEEGLITDDKDDHSLTTAINKIHKLERDKVHRVLNNKCKDFEKEEEPFYWSPDRKDILLFWLLNKVYTLEEKVEELEKKKK